MKNNFLTVSVPGIISQYNLTVNKTANPLYPITHSLFPTPGSRRVRVMFEIGSIILY